MLSDAKLAEYHRWKDHKRDTRSRIRGAIRHWNRLRCGPPTDDALAYYRDRRLAEGAAPATVRGELNKLVAIARWLGYPAVVKKPAKVQRAPEAWSRRELRKLFREARTTKRVIYGIPGNIYWPALLGVCYDTGERIGAVLSLRRDAYQSERSRRSIIYCAEVRKGGYRDAVARISRRTDVALRMLLRYQRTGDYVFLHGSRSTLWKAYGRLLADAGLPTDRRSKFHRLRRTHATYVHIAGGDATAALGHSSDAVTRESYLDPRFIRRRLPWRPWW